MGGTAGCPHPYVMDGPNLSRRKYHCILYHRVLCRSHTHISHKTHSTDAHHSVTMDPNRQILIERGSGQSQNVQHWLHKNGDRDHLCEYFLRKRGCVLASLVYDPCDVPPDVFMVPLITSQLCLQLVIQGGLYFLSAQLLSVFPSSHSSCSGWWLWWRLYRSASCDTTNVRK